MLDAQKATPGVSLQLGASWPSEGSLQVGREAGLGPRSGSSSSAWLEGLIELEARSEALTLTGRFSEGELCYDPYFPVSLALSNPLVVRPHSL